MHYLVSFWRTEIMLVVSTESRGVRGGRDMAHFDNLGRGVCLLLTNLCLTYFARN